MLKKLVIVLGVCFVVFLIAMSAPIASGQSSEECPPQGNSNISCVWVQHRTTGQCMWKPSNSLHNAWDPVPVGTCPQLQPTITPTMPQFTPVATNTAIIPVTGATSTPTSTQVEVIETTVPVIVEVPFGIPNTGDICDICLEERRQADALEEIAKSLATIAAKP